MQLYALLGNSQKLDGGAMFGNVPQALWAQWYPTDPQNRIQLACRCLLIVTAKQEKILLETGIGAFFEPNYRARFGVESAEHILLNSLAELGFQHTDIDWVILSHLHFDHAGGLLSAWQAEQTYELLFPRAKYLISHAAWERAQHPHSRDRASFIPELIILLQGSQRVELHSSPTHPELPDLKFWYSEGHTPGMLMTEILHPQGPIIFAADLIPGAAWVHLPVTMGYDRYPEKVIDEKSVLLNYLVQQHGSLFFTHDPKIAMAKIGQDAKGKFITTETYEDLKHL